MRETIKTAREARNGVFSRRLRNQMMLEGMCQTDLAAKMGVTKQLVSLWVKGERYPALHTLTRLAEVLHTSVEELSGAAPSVLEERLQSSFQSRPRVVYSLNHEETRFIEAYRNASRVHRGLVAKALGIGDLVDVEEEGANGGD